MAVSSRPNIILILTDDQGYGDLGCHGHPLLRTPALDRLHAESIRLTDFHVTPMCTPTRGSLLTGIDCLRNGAMATSLGRNLPRAELPTVADYLRRAGYRTGVFGKWHLGSSYPYRPMDRGFDEAIYHNGFGLTGIDTHWNNDYYDPIYLQNGEEVQGEGYCTDIWFQKAMEWMSECREESQPFFAYIPTNVPHFPMWISDQYKERFQSHAEAFDKEDADGFFGMIEELDENMAHLDAFLTEHGLREDTLLLFMSDNGHAGGASELYNAGMRGGKCSRYEGGHRVPCFVRWPGGGLREPGDVAALTQGQDILATLVEIGGQALDPAHPIDGESLLPLWKGDDRHLDDRTCVVQYFQNNIRRQDACVMWKKWRLVNHDELYDLNTDPGQDRDVAAEHPEIVARLQRHYDAWWEAREPGINTYSPLHVGNPAEEDVRLTSAEWQEVRADGTGCCRNLTARDSGGGPGRQGGPWKLLVEKAGDYQVELRRYPRESGLTFTEASPRFEARAGIIEEGVPAPIADARLVLNDQLIAESSDRDATQITYRVTLEEGIHQLQGWFVDATGEPVCGAFYAHIRPI